MVIRSANNVKRLLNEQLCFLLLDKLNEFSCAFEFYEYSFFKNLSHCTKILFIYYCKSNVCLMTETAAHSVFEPRRNIVRQLSAICDTRLCDHVSFDI